MWEVDAFQCSPLLPRSICFVCVFGCHQILQSWDYQLWDARTTGYRPAMTSDDWMTDCVSTSLHSSDVRCHPGDHRDHVRTSPQIPESQSPINETMSDHHLPRQRLQINLLCSALFVWLCWLLSASQFLFGCKFKCLTLAGIIVACHGRASDPSLTWSLSHQPGQGTSGGGNQAACTRLQTMRCLDLPPTRSWGFVTFYVKAKAFPSYFRKRQRM